MKRVLPLPVTFYCWFLFRSPSHKISTTCTWFYLIMDLYSPLESFGEITTTTALYSLLSLSWSRSSIASLAKINSCEWVIDSEANKYMTSPSKKFFTYSPCLRKDHVWITDGSYTPIANTSFVNCTPNITLSYVLHIPGFLINLLSIISLTNSLNCKVKFFPTYSIFEDLRTGKRICTSML